jgi:hypothetical protein
MRKSQRVLVLVHETLVPPDDITGFTAQQIDEWRTEYDVISSLRAMGHEIKVLGLGDNLAELRATILDWKPDIAFNLWKPRIVTRPVRGRVPGAHATAIHGLQPARDDDFT